MRGFRVIFERNRPIRVRLQRHETKSKLLELQFGRT